MHRMHRCNGLQLRSGCPCRRRFVHHKWLVITFVLLTDNYPAETTWNITDASGSIVLEGGPYDGSQTTYTSTICLDPGCYTLTVNDSYGDGLAIQRRCWRLHPHG